MSKRGYQFKEETIKCPLCSKHYTVPRILPCLHSFCNDCLAKHIHEGVAKQSDPNVSKSTQAHANSRVNQQTKATAMKNGVRGAPATVARGNTFNATKARENPRTKLAEIPEKPIEGQDANSGPQEESGHRDKMEMPGARYEAIDSTKAKPDGVQNSLKGFSCPCCRKFTTTPSLPKTTPNKWSELFPVNNLLADLVDLHSLKLGTRVCDPCKRNKASSQVHSYCKVCRDAMCEQCTKTHKALRSCRNHKVLATSEFSEAINSLKVEEEFCAKHENKAMDYYCYTHSTLCCSKCLSESHAQCDRTTAVAEAAKKCKETHEVEAIDGALDKYNSHIDIVYKDRSSLLKKLDGEQSKLMNEFIKIKSHIISQLEKMEKDLKTILDATHRQETKKIHQEVERCKEIRSAVTNSKELLKVADHHGASSQIVETIEKVRAECEMYEENIAILCSRMRSINYDIVLDPSLQQVIKRLNQFGRIDVKTQASKLPPSPKVASTLGLKSSTTKVKAVKPDYTLTGKNANEIGDFCARFADDTQDCWFTGAKFLPDGRILLADRTNRKLKMFTSNFNAIVDVMLSSKPWDIAVISDKEVAVSLPAECRIQFVSVEESSLVPTRSISSDEPCYGLCFSNDRIITVTYDGDPPNLKILSMTGQELTYVCVDDDGFTLFSKPVYVACSPKGSQIYVSDERLGCLVNLKETGELNFTYSAMDLGHAAGMAIDNDGHIYVCGNISNSVHVLSPSGERVKVLVTGHDISYPRAVAFESREKKLLVTQGDRDEVKVYSLA